VEVRVRFAPSPTGHLHIGGARTALFNWLFARHHKGTFILRIEDTDRSRSTDGFIQSIIEGMEWLNLDWDEGPYRQTERIEIYRNYADRLVQEGKAYHCYCSPEVLEQKRKDAMSRGESPKYDGCCRKLNGPSTGKTGVIRFKMPLEGEIVADDLIKGRVVFENAQLDDLIIVRSDGTPTYNFTVVVEDVDMKITHVIRGDDHLNNTPKQIHIYRALGYSLPRFAHLPMIFGHDKTRLSKRHGATSVLSYRDAGYLSHALVNYLVRLGWSHGDQEVFTMQELIDHFSFEHVGTSAAVFNPDKLLWLNSQHIIRSEEENLGALAMPFMIKERIIEKDQHLDPQWLSGAISTLKERSKTLLELSHALRYYICEDVEYNEKAKAKFLTGETLPRLVETRDALKQLDLFRIQEIERVFHALSEKNNIKLGKIAQPVRVALTGKTESPGIFDVIGVLGREKTIRRLEKAILTIESEAGRDE
jgi:glutamyl-tRNA synthetase